MPADRNKATVHHYFMEAAMLTTNARPMTVARLMAQSKGCPKGLPYAGYLLGSLFLIFYLLPNRT